MPTPHAAVEVEANFSGWQNKIKIRRAPSPTVNFVPVFLRKVDIIVFILFYLSPNACGTLCILPPIREKQAHPDTLLLVRVGDFYETWGLDALWLVQHCGLNAMGGLPRYWGLSLDFPLLFFEVLSLIQACANFQKLP